MTEPETPDAPAEEAGPSPEDEEKSRNWLYRIARSGVGAFVMAQEELESRLKKLTERSRKEALDDSVEEQRIPSEPSEPSEPSDEQDPVPAKAERRPVAEYIDRTVGNILHTIHLPTLTDVEELSSKIDALAEKVERLRG